MSKPNVWKGYDLTGIRDGDVVLPDGYANDDYQVFRNGHLIGPGALTDDERKYYDGFVYALTHAYIWGVVALDEVAA